MTIGKSKRAKDATTPRRRQKKRLADKSLPGKYGAGLLICALLCVRAHAVDINTLTCGVTVTDGKQHLASACGSTVAQLAQTFTFLSSSLTGLCSVKSTNNCLPLTDADVATTEIGWLAAEQIVLTGGDLEADGPVMLNRPLMLPMAGDDPGAPKGQPYHVLCAGPKIAGFVADHDFGAGQALIVAGDPSGTPVNGLGRYSLGTSAGLVENCGLDITPGYQMDGIHGGARTYTRNVEVRGGNAGFGLVGDHQVHDQLHLIGVQRGVYFQAPNAVLTGDNTFSDLKIEASVAALDVDPNATISAVFDGETYLSAPVAVYGEAGGCAPIISDARFQLFDDETMLGGAIVDGNSPKCRNVNTLYAKLHTNYVGIPTAVATINVNQINDSELVVDALAGSQSPTMASATLVQAPSRVSNPNAVAFIDANLIGGTSSSFLRIRGDIGDLLSQLGNLPILNSAAVNGWYVELDEPGHWSGRLQQAFGSAQSFMGECFEYSNGAAVQCGSGGAFLGVGMQPGLQMTTDPSTTAWVPIAKHGIVLGATGYTPFWTGAFAKGSNGLFQPYSGSGFVGGYSAGASGNPENGTEMQNIDLDSRQP